MTFHVVTLFPGALESYIGESIIKRAIEDKKISVVFYNPRDFSDNTFKHIDRPPYAGGPGMVIQAEPVIKAVEAALKEIHKKVGKTNKKTKPLLVWFTPGGTQFDTSAAKKIAKKSGDTILVCGRYEGVDARVKKVLKGEVKIEEVSVGPFVLTGGELPAMIVIDAISRHIEGVLGNFDSREEERNASHDVYTRPEVIEHNGKKYRVPKVLLSGNHKDIEEWRKNN